MFFKITLAILIKSVFPGYLLSLSIPFLLSPAIKGTFSRKYVVCIVLIFSVLTNLISINKLKIKASSPYRAHDAFSLKNGKKYRSNINQKFTTLHGDLCEIGLFIPAETNCLFFSGQRRTLFKTDTLGFAGIYEIDEANHILVGDSFLANSGGDDMRNSIGALLSSASKNKKYYQAAYPGTLTHYLKRVKTLDKITFPKILPLTFFVYEGNDLIRFKNLKRKRKETFLSVLYKHIKKSQYTPANKFIYYKYHQFRRNLLESTRGRKLVEIKTIGSDKVGFYTSYERVTNSNIARLPSEIDKLKDYAKTRKVCLVFIPTKGSAYLTNLSTEERHPILMDQFKELQNNGVKVIDLTSIFQSYIRDNKALDKPYHLFWTDDTHWNSKGMELATSKILSVEGCY